VSYDGIRIPWVAEWARGSGRCPGRLNPSSLWEGPAVVANRRHPGGSRDPCRRTQLGGTMDPGFRRDDGNGRGKGGPMPRTLDSLPLAGRDGPQDRAEGCDRRRSVDPPPPDPRSARATACLGVTCLLGVRICLTPTPGEGIWRSARATACLGVTCLLGVRLRLTPNFGGGNRAAPTDPFQLDGSRRMGAVGQVLKRADAGWLAVWFFPTVDATARNSRPR
jgi:hypothetical protein